MYLAVLSVYKNEQTNAILMSQSAPRYKAAGAAAENSTTVPVSMTLSDMIPALNSASSFGEIIYRI